MYYFRVDLLTDSGLLTRRYAIPAANWESASALAWECIRQDQTTILASGSTHANTTSFRSYDPMSDDPWLGPGKDYEGSMVA